MNLIIHAALQIPFIENGPSALNLTFLPSTFICDPTQNFLDSLKCTIDLLKKYNYKTNWVLKTLLYFDFRD